MTMRIALAASQKIGRTLVASSSRVKTLPKRQLPLSHHRQNKLFSNNREPNRVEAKMERPATQTELEAVQENLEQVVKDPMSLELFVKGLPRAQHKRLAQLTKVEEASSRTVKEPAWSDIQLVMLNTSIPFIGFGFMDNAILILAGDAIDHSLGVWLGISTMCAAAIGNIVSDVAGVGLGTIIEDWCSRHLKLPVPNISTAQRQLRSVRFANQLGCAIGLVIGCVIGMFPLLFLDTNRTYAKKREVALDQLFQDVVSEAGSLIGAQRTRLYIVCEKPHEKGEESASSSGWFGSGGGTILPNANGDFLYGKYTKQVGGCEPDHPKPNNSSDDQSKNNVEAERWIPLGRGLVSRAALTNQVWNIVDVNKEPDYRKDLVDTSRDFVTRNMLCVPVLDSSGNAVGVLQALNKIDGEDEGFTDGDEQTLQALASHVSVSLQRMYYEASEAEEEVHSLKHTIQFLKGSARPTNGNGEQREKSTETDAEKQY